MLLKKTVKRIIGFRMKKSKKGKVKESKKKRDDKGGPFEAKVDVPKCLEVARKFNKVAYNIKQEQSKMSVPA